MGCTASHDLLVTIEENAIMGGAGTAVHEYLSNEGIETPIMHLGLPDDYIEHGKHEELLASCGLDSAGIVKTIQKRQTGTASILKEVDGARN